ncbi:ABC transporter permease [Caldicellulosiruptor naganoensis]|uniref:ABC transporter permease n=1 Tax=Caldicellulosiruptor naganoensis TaxID=29324 RepID=A0ABY7BHQ7_9FIRM|nr:ABC transporter permease [Caldicellulosiruptor naganoensis]WAM30571.1 ABC transporter permease [Caldicellulosiruptor naganoensis]
MIFILVAGRIKNKLERNRNIPITIAVMLVCIIILSTGVVYSNARRTMLEQYWAKNGSADLIVLGKKDKLSSVNMMDCNYTAIGINTSGTLIEHNKIGRYGIIAYADINKVNEHYSLKLTNAVFSNEAIITSHLAKELNVQKNAIISINNTKYKIVQILESTDIFNINNDIVLINGDPDNYDVDTVCLLIDCAHNVEKINNLIDYFKAQDISYINRYENIKPLTDEFDNLLSNIYILFAAIAIIGGVLIYNTYSINVRKRLEYWGTLRTLGLKKSKVIVTMLMEICFYSILGIMFGVVFGIGMGILICILTDTNIYSYIPENYFTIIAIAISLIVPIMSVLLSTRKLLKKSPIEMLFGTRSTADKNRPRSAITIEIGIGILLIVLSVVDILMFGKFDDKTLVLVYSLQIILCLIGVIFILKPFIEVSAKFLMNIKNPFLRLACFNIKTNLVSLKGIVMSMVLTVIILYTIIGFSTNFKDWAVNMADRQLNFDFQIVYANNHLNTSNANAFIDDEKIEVVGRNYVDVATIKGINVYICATTADDFNAMYNVKINEKSISGNNVVLSSKVMKDLNIKPGDKVNLSLNGIEKIVTVSDKTDLLDNSAFAVYVSKDLFDISNYKKTRICGKISKQNSITELKSKASQRNLDFYSMTDIKTQWKENIVRGIEPLEYIIAAIIIALMLLLGNTILTNAEEKKHNFLILRSIGLKRKNVKTILMFEYLITEMVTILVSIGMGIVVSKKFFAINCIMSGFSVDYKAPIIQFALIGIAILILSCVYSLKIFTKISVDDIISEIRYY